MRVDPGTLLRLFADRARDIAILFVDPDGRIAWWSAGAEHVFGWAPSEIVGQPLARLFVPEDVAGGFAAQELAIAAKDGTSEDERWMLRSDGSRFWASGAVVALRDDAGALLGYGKMLRDRTEVREQLETLRNQLDDAHAANHRKDVFLSTLSHELRNPLAPLVNASHLVRLAAAATPTLEPPLRIIDRQIDVLRRLVDDLVEVSRGAAGKAEIRPEPIDLRDVVEQAILSTRPIVDRLCHDLQVFAPARPMVVAGDRVRLEQVFVNLLTNAARYTPPGGRIWVKSTIEGDEAVVRVEDTGVGIAPEMVPSIFDLFTQVDSAGAREGLGIGLAVVKDLVTRHGGSVQVMSHGPSKGSEFTVRLPLST